MLLSKSAKSKKFVFEFEFVFVFVFVFVLPSVGGGVGVIEPKQQTFTNSAHTMSTINVFEQ